MKDKQSVDPFKIYSIFIPFRVDVVIGQGTFFFILFASLFYGLKESEWKEIKKEDLFTHYRGLA